MRLTVAQIAELCAGEVEGDSEFLITGANTLEDASATDLAYAATPKTAVIAERSHAGCLLVYPDFRSCNPRTLIRVENPRVAFAKVLGVLYPPKTQKSGIHNTAVIAASARIAPSASIGAYVSIGAGTEIGGGCCIHDNCSIGDYVKIGSDSILDSGVRIYDGVRIGARAVLHAGCVIGADGFGFTLNADHYEKFPQVGTVEIGDDVEIGANSCVDRAALGATRIADGVKLDNLVHVGHNCAIGKHAIVAAQTGFSGSVTVGDYAVIGGQVGIGEKAVIQARAIVGGKAGILTGQRIAPAEPVWGIPARPLKQHLKGLANVAKLPELREEVRKLKQAFAELTSDRKEKKGKS